MQIDAPFTPLIVPLMAFTETNEKLYRVYSEPGKYVLVEAGTAYEAIELSGIARPLKLVHVIPNDETIFNESKLKLLPPATVEALQQEAPAAMDAVMDDATSDVAIEEEIPSAAVIDAVQSAEATENPAIVRE